MTERAQQIPIDHTTPEQRPAALGALLLVAREPVPVSVLAQHLGCSVADAEAALAVVAERLAGVGMRLQWPAAGEVQLVSDPGFASLIQRFLGLERTVRLSQAALETLAIIAFRQPVTRADIEAIRGVDSSGVLQTLLSRGLVDQVGRLATVGNPAQYATTPEFLRFFGLSSLDELPAPPDEILTTENEDGADRQT